MKQVGQQGRALFTKEDYAIVRMAKSLLDPDELTVLDLLYWENLSLSEVAIATQRDWDAVHATWRRALFKLRIRCLENSSFSRRNMNHGRSNA